ncbi:MAG TPA: hypothetical protein VEP49_17180 [Acidimicrobiia bacterium]|nr:hypothetical protein [Acidimicrobiia bacterium]
MHAYTTAGWDDFLLAQVGAAAALTGLLFVAISINLQRILQFAWLPGRAATTVVILVTVLLVASVGLAPGQSARVFGAEALVIAGLATMISFRLHVGTRAQEVAAAIVSRRRLDVQVGLTMLSTALLAIAGASLLAQWGGGLYWLVPGVVLSFVVAIVNTWVLMIEILR